MPSIAAAERLLDIASGMEHAQDPHFVIGGLVKDQMLSESCNWSNSRTGETLVGEIPQRAGFRHLAELLHRSFNSVEKP